MAAGLGFIEFTTGDVLTAAAANGYLASQVVMVFDDAAARTAAITSPQEGMITYLKDTNAVEKYDGAAFVAVGGGSSPLTTKGDLYTFDTADARLGVGANGSILVADSVEATGLKWAAPAGGKVLQIQSGSLSTSFTTSSATYADAGLSVTITPSSASSKILLLGNFNYRKDDGNAGNRANLRILRNSTTVFEDLDLLWTNTAIYLNSNYSLAYLDSPNTTSAITYKLQAANANATANIIINYSAGTTFYIYALEIGA